MAADIIREMMNCDKKLFQTALFPENNVNTSSKITIL